MNSWKTPVVVARRKTKARLLAKRGREGEWGEDRLYGIRSSHKSVFFYAWRRAATLVECAHHGAARIVSYNREPLRREQAEEVVKRDVAEKRRKLIYVLAVMARNSFSQWIQQYAGHEAASVAKFCERNRIVGDLKEAISSVEACFPSRVGLRVFVDDDPEAEGQWIVVEVATGLEVSDFLDAYDRCIALWAANLPTRALGLIRLSYNLA